MEAIIYGIGTTHAPGAFCRRGVRENVFIAYFETPFLYERDGKLVRGNPKEMLVIPPGIPVYHGPVPEAQEGFVNHWIYLRGENMEEHLKKYPVPICSSFPVTSHKVFLRYLDAVMAEQTEQKPGYEDQIYYLTAQLLIDLHRMVQSGREEDEPTSRVRRAREEILTNLDKNWTLEEMAHLSGYSVSRFSALYRSIFGLSPKQEFLEARIHLAEKMLTFTNVTVTEAALACGFHSIYYFSKFFKKVTGRTPSEYIQGN